MEEMVLSEDEKKKIAKQEYLRKQVDFKVKVRKGRKDKWEDFTGLYLMEEGWTKDKVTQHVKESFSTAQFRCYTFGLFKRYYNNTSNTINNNYKFQYQHNITLLEEKVVREEGDD
jgi:hypothetical protein